MLSEPHVNAGNLRVLLYHEGSHLWGYQDVAAPGTSTADEFAATCRQAETVSIDTETSAFPGGGDGGGKEGDTCYEIVWWWTDTGQVIKRDFLGCW